MEAKAALFATKPIDAASLDTERMKEAIEAQTNSIRADALRLSLVEQLIGLDDIKAKQMFNLIKKPERTATSATLHRLHARWWTCKAKLQPNMRRIALREAITQHRAAGCPRAAKTLEAQLHSLL